MCDECLHYHTCTAYMYGDQYIVGGPVSPVPTVVAPMAVRLWDANLIDATINVTSNVGPHAENNMWLR